MPNVEECARLHERIRVLEERENRLRAQIKLAELTLRERQTKANDVSGKAAYENAIVEILRLDIPVDALLPPPLVTIADGEFQDGTIQKRMQETLTQLTHTLDAMETAGIKSAVDGR